MAAKSFELKKFRHPNMAHFELRLSFGVVLIYDAPDERQIPRRQPLPRHGRRGPRTETRPGVVQVLKDVLPGSFQPGR